MGVLAAHDEATQVGGVALSRGEADGDASRDADGPGHRREGAGELLAEAHAPSEEGVHRAVPVAGRDAGAVLEALPEEALEGEGPVVVGGGPFHDLLCLGPGDGAEILGQRRVVGEQLGRRRRRLAQFGRREAGDRRDHAVLGAVGGGPLLVDDEGGRRRLPTHVEITAVDGSRLVGRGQPDGRQGLDGELLPDLLGRPGRGDAVGQRALGLLEGAAGRPDLAVEAVERGHAPVGRDLAAHGEHDGAALVDQAGADVDQGAEGHPRVVAAAPAVERDQAGGVGAGKARRHQHAGDQRDRAQHPARDQQRPGASPGARGHPPHGRLLAVGAVHQQEHEGGGEVDHRPDRGMALGAQHGGEHHQAGGRHDGLERGPEAERRPVGHERQHPHRERGGEEEARARTRGRHDLLEALPAVGQVGRRPVPRGPRRRAVPRGRGFEEPDRGHDQHPGAHECGREQAQAEGAGSRHGDVGDDRRDHQAGQVRPGVEQWVQAHECREGERPEGHFCRQPQTGTALGGQRPATTVPRVT